LNRRLAPDVYLGVVEIKKKGDTFTLGGQGEVVEVAVQMRQLPQEKALDRLLQKGEVGAGMMDELAEVIARFHNKAETDERITDFGKAGRIRISIEENFEQTQGYIGTTIPEKWFQQLRDYSYAFLDEEGEIFTERMKEGKIRNCHGDLHAQNVYFWDQIYILDCIEFNERFRFIDVACDVAFLIMDLEYRGFMGLANRFLNTYLQHTGDYGLVGMLDFYKIYRAYVRGKIASFESSMEGLPHQQKEEARQKAESYFSLAYRYLKRGKRPILLATTGVIGSGKTHLARTLANLLEGVVIRSDAVRKAIAGVEVTEHRYEPFGKGIYSEAFTKKVYDQLLVEARGILAAGLPVILDASFSKGWQREKVAAFAQANGCPFLFIQTLCRKEAILKRLQDRESRGRDISDARADLMEAQMAS